MDSSAAPQITPPPTTQSSRPIFGVTKKHLAASPKTNKSPTKATRSFLPSSVSGALASSTLKMPHPLKWKMLPSNPLTSSPPWTSAVSPHRRSRSSTTASMSSASGCENEDPPVSLATPLLRTPPKLNPRVTKEYHSPQVSPPSPCQLSFDQLIFSNQTLRVSLTPNTCLDSDSNMMSGHSNGLLNSSSDFSCLSDSSRFAMTTQEVMMQKKEPRSPLVCSSLRFAAPFHVEDSDEEVILAEEAEGCSIDPPARLQSLAEFLEWEPPLETDVQPTVIQKPLMAMEDCGGAAGPSDAAARKKSRKSWLPKRHS